MREIEIKNIIAEKVLHNRYTVVANSSEMAEVDKQHKDYQKESKRLMDFCRKIIDKRNKQARYIDYVSTISGPTSITRLGVLKM